MSLGLPEDRHAAPASNAHRHGVRDRLQVSLDVLVSMDAAEVTTPPIGGRP